MEHTEEFDEVNRPKEEGYVPRPVYQVWTARIGLVAVIVLLILQIIRMISGTL